MSRSIAQAPRQTYAEAQRGLPLSTPERRRIYGLQVVPPRLRRGRISV
ncbi:MAG: hypothetical protein IPF99_22740 [Deltaproteobacteria bacterium]|nr:hypothetical protein [Deltaproteobacteria bacterium]